MPVTGSIRPIVVSSSLERKNSSPSHPRAGRSGAGPATTWRRRPRPPRAPGPCPWIPRGASSSRGGGGELAEHPDGDLRVVPEHLVEGRLVDPDQLAVGLRASRGRPGHVLEDRHLSEEVPLLEGGEELLVPATGLLDELDGPDWMTNISVRRHLPGRRTRPPARGDEISKAAADPDFRTTFTRRSPRQREDAPRSRSRPRGLRSKRHVRARARSGRRTRPDPERRQALREEGPEARRVFDASNVTAESDPIKMPRSLAKRRRFGASRASGRSGRPPPHVLDQQDGAVVGELVGGADPRREKGETAADETPLEIAGARTSASGREAPSGAAFQQGGKNAAERGSSPRARSVATMGP